MLHAGLDLSRKRLDVCLIDEHGELIAETAVPADADGLKARASPSRPRSSAPRPSATSRAPCERTMTCAPGVRGERQPGVPWPCRAWQRRCLLSDREGPMTASHNELCGRRDARDIRESSVPVAKLPHALLIVRVAANRRHAARSRM